MVIPMPIEEDKKRSFIEKNLFSIMLFSLCVTALCLYAYNQTDAMKEITLVLLGGFIVDVTRAKKESNA